jgi:Fe-S cluster biogenesis protein NfuA
MEGVMLLDDRNVRERVARVDSLLAALESISDPGARSTAEEVVRALLELYGEGLARMLERVSRLGDEQILEALVEDELVKHLLLLHGLHPDDPQTRVRQALEELGPYLQSQGSSVELVAVDGAVARLRLSGASGGCSSPASLKRTVEQAIQNAAPDLEGIETELMPPTPTRPPATFIPLAELG